MRCLSILFLTLFLTGCANVEFDEIASAGAATAGCAVGSAVAGPVGCAAGAAPAATLTVISTEPSAGAVDPNNFRGDDGELSFTEAAAFAWSEFSRHLIGIGIIIAAFLLLSTYLGARMKRPEEKSMEKQMSMLVDKIGRMKDG